MKFIVSVEWKRRSERTRFNRFKDLILIGGCNQCAAVSTRLSTTPVSFSFATSTQFTFDSFWPSRVVHEGHFQTLNDFFFLILNNFQSISFLSVFIFGVLVSMSWQPQKYKIRRNLFLKVRSD